MHNPKIWLVTGANSGFGRAITDAVDAITAQLDGVRAELTTWEVVARDTAFPGS